MYDLLAKKIFQYVYIYPFIELVFGLAFLASFQLRYITIVEIAVMGFSSIGVFLSVLKNRGYNVLA